MSTEERETRGGGYSAGDVLGPVAEKRTYTNLVYLLLAFPLGLAYYTLLLFGFTFGAILSVLLIGVAILIVTVGGSRVLAAFERWLANVLLETNLQPYEDVASRSTSSAGLVSTVERYLDASSTWRGLGFLMLKLWVGIVGIVLLVLLLSALSVLTAPLHYPYEAELITVNDEPIVWTIETLPEALLAVPIGAVLALVAVHLVNAVAYVVSRMAIALLGEPTPDAGSVSESEPETELDPKGDGDLDAESRDRDPEPDTESMPDSESRSNAARDQPSASSSPSESDSDSDSDSDSSPAEPDEDASP